ncbi:hypothetical protein [Palleronia rufa]|uniref:hypothetical protein n=1 Tax=Palleronia rufa TaxID=1530186 RepID=UPI0005623E55|nr:hypothetical protein [Palleronia rufa]
MAGQFERYAADKKWTPGTANVLVEGTTDVAYLQLAKEAWQRESGHDLFGDGFAVFAAGLKDDGGVQGVTRELTTCHNLARRDFENRMGERRIVGLFDDDHAGRKQMDLVCQLDFRIKPYRDVFLLHPVMPTVRTSDWQALRNNTLRDNRPFEGLDHEIEDLLSEDLLREFEHANPGVVTSRRERAGRVHRDLTPEGKRLLRDHAKREALMEDLLDLVRLLCTLRAYLGLPFDGMRP